MPDTNATYHRARGLSRARGTALRGRAAAKIAALGACLALSTASAASASTPELVITGAGWGHGVGMSQDGALGFALHGYSYAQILAHYYSRTTLGQAPANTRIRVLIGRHVRSIPLETYVRGVVSAEMPSSWPAAALEAQAVAARTYALTAHAGGSRFDVYSDTRSQVYKGAAAYTAATDAAVAATAGQIVTYEGEAAITYFFASSGGRTENVENAFPGAASEPWLRGVPDPFERSSQHTWSIALTYAAASARLRGIVQGAFQGIEVLRRGYSPRILTAYVIGSRGRTLTSGAELAWRLGLAATWAYFGERNGLSLSAMPDRSGRAGAPAPETPGAPEAPLGAGGGVQPTGEPEATAKESSAKSGGTSAPATASAASYSEATPEQVAWVRRAAARFVRAELHGDGAEACAVLVARLRSTHGRTTCAARWDAHLRRLLRDGRVRAQLRHDTRVIPSARVEVRGSLATIALPAALMNGESRFRWTENCWMLEP